MAATDTGTRAQKQPGKKEVERGDVGWGQYIQRKAKIYIQSSIQILQTT